MRTPTRPRRRPMGTRDPKWAMPYRSIPVTAFAYAGTIEDPKFGGRVVYESGIERDALIHLVFEPSVRWVRRNDLTNEQRIQYRMPTADRRNWELTLEDGSAVVADLIAGLTDGRTLLIEVGSHAHKTSPEEGARLQKAAIVAAAEGAGYIVLTDRMLRGRLLENRRVLFGWLAPVSAEEPMITAATAAFAGAAQRSIQEVVAELHGSTGQPEGVLFDAARTAVARAHREGRLRCALDSLIFDVATPCAIVPEVTR